MIILSASDAIIRDINILDAVFEIDNFYQPGVMNNMKYGINWNPNMGI